MPTSFGQELKIESSEQSNILWHSSYNKKEFFQAKLNLEGEVLSSNDEEMAERLALIFKSILLEKGLSFFEPTIFHSNMDFPESYAPILP